MTLIGGSFPRTLRPLLPLFAGLLACLGTILAYVGLAILHYLLLPQDVFLLAWAGRILLSFALGVLLVRLLHAPVKLTKWALGLIVLCVAALELNVLTSLSG